MDIIEYGDFFDVPRLILAVDGSSSYFIFDSLFDDVFDDYSKNYNIYCISDCVARKGILYIYAMGGLDNAHFIANVPLMKISFDESKRKILRVESGLNL